MSHSAKPIAPQDSPSQLRANRAVVIGLYGIPGSGKTSLLKKLREELGEKDFMFCEGSEVIASLVPGGLEAFRQLEEHDKVELRQIAIDKIKGEASASGRAAVVVGHFSFWSTDSDNNGDARSVWTRHDLKAYTHILYLDIPSEIVLKRCANDVKKRRATFSCQQLHRWQQYEKAELRQICPENSILFTTLSSSKAENAPETSALVADFSKHTEEHNAACAETKLDEILQDFQARGQVQTVLIWDADKTLIAEDTGTMFWRSTATTSEALSLERMTCPLKTLFGSELGYSYLAFRQAALLYEEIADEDFESMCEKVASAVSLHPEILSLLRHLAGKEYIASVVVSCGIGRVWELIVDRAGLAQTVRVLAGGRISDGLVVTAGVKAALVSRLRNVHGMYVWAFGDSVLDLPMMHAADQAVVVVGDEQSRSKSMDKALAEAIDQQSEFRPRQTLLPATSPPRLDATRLPLVQLKDDDFLASLTERRSERRSERYSIPIRHATARNSSRLLMTPMRDARIAGPALREFHVRVGNYLATEFVSDLLGLEEFEIPHVQGHQISGFRLVDEQRTVIVAMMRGGEPLAFGVNGVFPLASFIHAREPCDVKPENLQHMRTVLLVDSVINSGKSIADFVTRIRALHETIHIVVVAGVVQGQSIAAGGTIHALLASEEHHPPQLSLVALRVSDNKFTGRGTTDTGNRLFNTTHLD